MASSSRLAGSGTSPETESAALNALAVGAADSENAATHIAIRDTLATVDLINANTGSLPAGRSGKVVCNNRTEHHNRLYYNRLEHDSD